MVPSKFEWQFASKSEVCQNCEVQRECLKERLLKISEWEKGRKLKRETNVCYRQFIRDTDMPEGSDKERSWPWLRKCDLKIPSEALISRPP